MTALRQISDRLTAKQILYIVDACYSGYAIFNRAIADDLLEEMVKKPAIQILTAGRQQDEAQERAGHGVFTDVLVRGLTGEAFAPGKAWLALEELGLWVKQRVFADRTRSSSLSTGTFPGKASLFSAKWARRSGHSPSRPRSREWRCGWETGNSVRRREAGRSSPPTFRPGRTSSRPASRATRTGRGRWT